MRRKSLEWEEERFFLDFGMMKETRRSSCVFICIFLLLSEIEEVCSYSSRGGGFFVGVDFVLKIVESNYEWEGLCSCAGLALFGVG